MKIFSNYIFAILIGLSFASCRTQKDLSYATPIHIKAVPDYSKPLEVYESFKLDVVIDKNSGRTVKTRGIDGHYPWSKLKIALSEGYFNNGYVYFNRSKLKSNTIFVHVSSELNSRAADTFSVKIPAVTNIKLSTAQNYLWAGKAPQIKCTFTFSSGRKFESDSYPHLLQMLSANNGAICITIDGFAWSADYNKNFYPQANFKTALTTDTSIADSIYKDISYVEQYCLNVNGISGYSGRDGRNGSSGSASGNINGENGTSGEDGQRGEDGKDVDVRISSITFGNDTIWKVQISSHNGEFTKWLNMTQKSRLSILSKGGNGGNGGKGGDGGNGADATGKINAGYGGHGGNGGNAGDGGNGGNIKISIDKQSYKFADRLSHDNRSGIAGITGNNGRRGTGGVKQNAKLANILYTGRGGTSGSDGANGHDGKSGKYKIEVE